MDSRTFGSVILVKIVYLCIFSTTPRQVITQWIDDTKDKYKFLYIAKVSSR